MLFDYYFKRLHFPDNAVEWTGSITPSIDEINAIVRVKHISYIWFMNADKTGEKGLSDLLCKEHTLIDYKQYASVTVFLLKV
jgi:hypothetical protein